MEGSSESGNSPADDNDIVVIVHWVDYSYTNGNVKAIPTMELIRIKLTYSNAYLIKDKRSILVDSGAPRQADQILAAVKRAGGTFRGSWIETFLQNGQFSSFFSSAFVGCGGAAGCDSAWGGASSSSILRTTRGVTSNIR